MEICEKLNDVFELAQCFLDLAWSLRGDGQLDAAEEAAYQVINLLPEDQYLVFQCHYTLVNICEPKGEMKKVAEHLKVALSIASSFNWHNEQFFIHCALALHFGGERRFGNAQAQVEHARAHAVHSAYFLARTTELQALLWWWQGRFEEARSEALCAVDLLQKIGAIQDLEICRDLITRIDARMRSPGHSR